MGIPLLIDTDAGEDVGDVLAIAFAALRFEFDIKAITTVTSEAIQRMQSVNAVRREVAERFRPRQY